MDKKRVAVLGARSLIGDCLLEDLTATGWKVVAFSRKPVQSDCAAVEWRRWPAGHPPIGGPISHWISLLPIWILPEFFPLLELYGARHVVALSSTSRFVKADSPDEAERAVAASLCKGETEFEAWAEKIGVQWTLLRSTLIYGLGRDKNIAEIARFIGRFGFFPLFADGRGLRQPIHARDVAKVCAEALFSERGCINRAYNISGAESISYRGMVKAVFIAMDTQPRFIPVPLWAARLVLPLVRLSPRYRHWSVAMLERMGRDLVFDHEDATRDHEFKPQAFLLSSEDVPS